MTEREQEIWKPHDHRGRAERVITALVCVAGAALALTLLGLGALIALWSTAAG